MKAVMRLRTALLATSAGACAGGLVLLALSGERASEAALFVSANGAPAIAVPDSMRELGWDVALCQTPVVAPMTRGMIRLVATQTEVPQARSNAASPALAFADSDPPLWDGLGSLTYKVTTSSAAAQSYFDQGLRLTHAFNHEEAQRAFRKAQKLDPDCAMCFWGEALVLGPNINMPMVEEAVAPAFAAAQRARALAAKASPQEQALIAALSKRYADNPKADRAELDTAYAAAMAQAAAQFPQDNEIAVLYAEALMDLSPWNYWQPAGGNRTRRAPRSCRHWSACSPRTPIIPARSTTTSMPWKRRTARSAPSLTPTACAVRFRAPAISCTCRVISITASGVTSTRSWTTRPRLPWTRSTWRRATPRWASIGWATTRTMSTSSWPRR
jgi:hypothetical protein